LSSTTAAAPPLPAAASVPRGAALFALAQLCLVLDGAAVHHLGPEVAVQQVTLLRAAGAAALLALLLAARRQAPLAALRTARPGLQLLRGALTVVPLWLVFWGVARVPLAEATAIGVTLPAWMTLLGALLLRERVGAPRWAATALGLAGAALVVVAGGGAPRFGAWDAAHLAILAGVALNAAGLVATRALARVGDAPATTLAWVTLVGLALSLPGALAAPAPPPWGAEWPALLLVAVAGAGAVWFGLLAARACDLSALAPFGHLRLPIAALLGLTVFGEAPSPAALAGGALIVLAGALPWLLSRRPGTPRSRGAAPGG
jgi:drug/metabolite transporter (DMT)-like permease